MKCFLLLCTALAMCACTDENLVELVPTKDESGKQVTDELTRLAFASESDVKKTIDLLEAGASVTSLRSFVVVNGLRSTGDFQSLWDVEKQRALNGLTDSQLDSVRLDEDGLEFDFQDPVIADERFAQLLNANREVQVGGVVYRYFENGVAYTDAKNVGAIDSLKNEIARIDFVDSVGKRLFIGRGVHFIPIPYRRVIEDTGTDGTRSNGEELVLGNGDRVPSSSIRDVDYDSKGDGNWIHRAMTGAFGRNVVALNKFRKRRQVNLNFYEQNYIIYENLGTKLKLQKKVAGIWWNIKAREMRQGWTVIEMKHKFPQTVETIFLKQAKPAGIEAILPKLPEFISASLSYKSGEVMLFHIPFFDYKLSLGDAERLLKMGLQRFASPWVSRVLSNNLPSASNVGVYSAQENDLYIMVPGDEKVRGNVKSMETKFHTQWFPGKYSITFALGGGQFNVSKVDIGKAESTRIARGVVYGVVHYDGRWIGARISKKQ